MLRFLRGSGKHTKTIWWAIAIITIVTFVGGFVFLFGAGLDPTQNARTTGAVALVNGERVSHGDYQTALAQQRDAYRSRFGTDPADRDLKMLEIQTWRQLVTERLVAQKALEAGLKAGDREVVLGLQTNPPQALVSAPDFQTDGKFDYQKYRAALQNPNNNWAPFEDLMRQQLPMRKLEERLVASIKVSEGELRQVFLDRTQRYDAAVVSVVPGPDVKVPPPGEAEIRRAYEEYKGRFASGPRVQLEVLRVPKQLGAEETRAATELAKSLVDRARRGEKFEDLARDFSEGPGAEQGGVLPRPMSPMEFGPQIGPLLMAAKAGDVLDPIPDASRFVILKVLEKLPPTPQGAPQLRLAQIVVKARANENTLRQQYDELKKLRDRAARSGLGEAATSKGLSTFKTAPFDFNNPPNELFTAPEAAEWGLGAKPGEVSPVFEGIDEFVIAQVSSKHGAGVPTREEIAEPLRQIADLEARVEAVKPRADAVAKAIGSGQSLEQAAQAQGLTVVQVTGMTRAAPDPRVAAAPEFVGALTGAAPGRIVGPVRALNGWYFGRLEKVSTPPDSLYEQGKRQLINEILQNRQQSFFMGLVANLRDRAKVKDLRATGQ